MRNVEIIDFKLEHFDLMEMREHEFGFRNDLDVLAKESIEAKTALVDGIIWSTWGIIKDNDRHYFWQIPSNDLKSDAMFYARRAYKVIRDMVSRYKNAYTFCIDDDLHKRWMNFIGFKLCNDLTFVDNKIKHLMYEVR